MGLEVGGALFEEGADALARVLGLERARLRVGLGDRGRHIRLNRKDVLRGPLTANSCPCIQSQQLYSERLLSRQQTFEDASRPDRCDPVINASQ